MFLPLYDVNRLRFIRRQYVTLAIIVANVGVHAVLWAAGSLGLSGYVVVSLGYIPSVVNDIAELPPELVSVPEEATLLTYSFLHANWMHLGTNMLFLWVFGDNVEDALGHFRFAVFYALCAAAGALAHGWLMPASENPLIGASGAVAGVSAAYLMLHPRVRVWILVLYRIPLPIPAWVPLGLWVAMQFVMIAADPFGEVSWAAHVGGILAGAALMVVMRRRGVPLFDRRIVPPEAAILGPPGTNPHPLPRWGRG